MSLDASHTLTVKGAPGALPFVAGNGEISATDDAGLLQRVASALDFLGVARVELQGTERAVDLNDFHAEGPWQYSLHNSHHIHLYC